MPLPFGAGPHQQQQQNGYGQGTVAPAPQSAPPLPAGIDLSVLQSMTPEQVAAVAQLIQLGLIKPPPMPGANTAVPAPPPAPAPAPTANQAPQVVPQAAATTQVQDQDMETEKEEGELEEGEEPDTAGREFLRPPPTGPRKRSASPIERYGRATMSIDSRASAPDRRGSPPFQKVRKVSEPISRNSNVAASDQPRSASGSLPARSVNKSAAARSFVMQMHNAGYTFDQLAEHVPNRNALEKLYRSLGLSIPPRPVVNGSNAPVIQPPLSNGTTVTSAQSTPPETRTTTLTRRPAPPARPAPANRADYLAKLAAAKAGKSSTAKPFEKFGASLPLPASPAVESEPTAPNGPTGAAHTLTPPPIATPTATNQSHGEVAAIKKISFDSEKLKQRMEALRAENAAKAREKERLASSDSAAASSPARAAAQSVDPGAGREDPSTQVAPVSHSPTPSATHIQIPPPQSVPMSATSRSVPGTPGRPFIGLPGLFMAPSPVQVTAPAVSQSSAVNIQPTASALPAQPSAALLNTHTSVASPSGSPAPLNVARLRNAPNGTHVQQTRPPVLGQSRSSSESDRLVIEVSEDEDENEKDVMEADGNGATKRRPDHLPNFPDRSGLSTPDKLAAATPGTLSAYELKMKEIEAQKRRIAEIEARAKAKKTAAQASGKSTPSAVQLFAPEKALSPSIATERGNINDGLHKAVSPSQSNSSGGRSAKALAREEERAMLEKRLKELHEAVQSGKPMSTRADTGSALTGIAAHRADAVDDERNPTAAELVKSDAVTESQQHGSLPITNDHDVDMDSANQENSPNLSEGEDNQVTINATIDDGKAGTQATTTGFAPPETAADEIANLAAKPVIDPSNTTESPANDDAQVQLTSGEPMDNAIAPSADESDGIFSKESENDSDLQPASEVQHAFDLHVVESRPLSSTVTEYDTSDDSSDNMDTEEQDYDNTDSDDDDDDDDDEAEYEPAIISSTSTPATAQPLTISDNVRPNRQGEADDLAAELQPSREEQTTIKQVSDEEEHKQAVLRTTGFYKPYESPLKYFHDYRFHPDYPAQVKGGFRSLTYSNQIDWDQHVCPTSMAGEKCTYRFCAFQHYEQMVKTDSLILQELGTYRFPTGDAVGEKRWREGLTAVIKQLRNTEDGRDVEKIAAHIVAFRRSFVGDPSKLLTTLA